MAGARAAVLALLLALLGFGPALAQPRFPALSGRVVDAANILPPATESQLTQRLTALETATGRQLVVATVPDLQGYEIEEYGYQLGRAWGVGSRARNDGALLLVAPNERRVRIEGGYGLEGVLTDALTSVIIREQILPRFRAGDMPGGVVAGTEAIATQLTADPEAARRTVAQAAERRGGQGSIWPILLTGLMIWLAFSFLGGIFGRGRRGRRRGGAGWIAPAIVFGSGLGRGGWSGGGGGFGGGGFSGGGGSFGGGGSSGGW